MVTASILVLFLMGFGAAALLGVSSKVFAVEEDSRVEAIMEVLPGSNCGGCGYAGCEGYAAAVLNDPNVPANLCVAGGAETGVNVGGLAGKALIAAEPHISFRRCEKINGKVGRRFQYLGISSCAAASLLANGDGADMCAYSCLGYGDCVQACLFDAMYMHDGLVRIESEKCTGCALCVKTCPRGVLQILPRRARVMAACSTLDKGKAVLDVCETGCIKCMKCVRACPAEAISLTDGKIDIAQTVCLSYAEDCAMSCVKSCPQQTLQCLIWPPLNHRLNLQKESEAVHAE